MIVLDASAAAALLLDQDEASEVIRALGDVEIAAPDHLGIELLSVLRGWVRSGQLPEIRARKALDDLDDLGILWFPTQPLLRAAWRLRENASAYDAIYLALVQQLTPDDPDVHLVTLDARLARAFPRLAVVPGT
ncbi:MAG: type II toxin-antitoxin system VapC family toxin [Brachybacterium sp.]|uniref:type II toxin-antitoxin system VapC family toxin n=1 Tax=Brachybacterium sp. TaxID=1891286 RepID=UPI0026485372|nr:type II toxin-antitoxin system VapC family toxin [Brachybacterium sp.]MDN5687187.1 type II toxin-antitoxin system VapC family toxin [Brachybacterium sp.]